MKAWYVEEKGGDCGEIHWAETRGKAKQAARQKDEWVSADWCDWTDIICRRAPVFDGEPRKLTCHDWVAAGYRYDCDDCYDFVCEDRYKLEAAHGTE